MYAFRRLLGAFPSRPSTLECWSGGRIPPARRDFNGRIYSAFDIALLRSLGVGARPRRLKRPEEVLSG
jgi:hypothetical protein